jgi:hypothetical protein
MLALDSQRWTELTHAGGSAQNIPTLLRQLEHEPDRMALEYRPHTRFMTTIDSKGGAAWPST